ncbi:MAG TPA: efflux RND transporter periplasmic adaptor subunit [Vicinamibacterales bacterium]|nr:efflux RND transporter periplasmic adaptor subunit [Vicinamibacterales bacterium]
MRKLAIIGLLLAAAGGAAVYFGVFSKEQAAAAAGGPGGAAGAGGAGRAGGAQSGRPGGGGGGPMGIGGGFRPPITVQMAPATKGNISATMTVVGNLIGAQTVDVVPRTAGRLVSVNVQLGDRVRRNQLLAKIEDFEIVEQVKQAEASLEVARATIRQREADLKVAELNFERSKNLFGRQLLAKQALDDAESRFLAAQAQLDLSKAQSTQTSARLDELQINLANTRIISPVDGFVGKRNADAGAWASQQAPVVSVVDISRLRLVANVVEKDLRLVNVGDPANIEVDAFPEETFKGRIARVAPVLDPATRTAPMEVEVSNADNRLKPGMYAKVLLIIEERKDTTLVPKMAVVDFEGKRGVWLPEGENKARFAAVKLGLEDAERMEILDGLKPGDRVVTEGAASLRAGDTMVLPGEVPGGAGGGRRPGMGGAAGGGGRGQGGPPAPAKGQNPRGEQSPR